MPGGTARTEAVVPIIIKKGRVLVIKRGPDVVMPGYWCPPSGGIEAGETQDQAVVREVAEELGIDARAIAKIWECPTDDGTYTLHWWLTDAGSDEIRPDPREVADIRWVTADEFLALEPTFVKDRDFFVSVLPGLATPNPS